MAVTRTEGLLPFPKSTKTWSLPHLSLLQPLPRGILVWELYDRHMFYELHSAGLVSPVNTGSNHYTQLLPNERVFELSLLDLSITTLPLHTGCHYTGNRGYQMLDGWSFLSRPTQQCFSQGSRWSHFPFTGSQNLSFNGFLPVLQGLGYRVLLTFANSEFSRYF